MKKVENWWIMRRFHYLLFPKIWILILAILNKRLNHFIIKMRKSKSKIIIKRCEFKNIANSIAFDLNQNQFGRSLVLLRWINLFILNPFLMGGQKRLSGAMKFLLSIAPAIVELKEQFGKRETTENTSKKEQSLITLWSSPHATFTWSVQHSNAS